MESNGLVNTIQVTQPVKDRLDGRYDFEPRGPVLIKGKGEMITYLLRPLGTQKVSDDLSEVTR
jgi:hypothetical protein